MKDQDYFNLPEDSQSDVTLFLNSPIDYYRKKILGARSETKNYLELGSVAHKYILEPEEFAQTYTLCTAVTPHGQQQIDFCDSVASSDDDHYLVAYKLFYKTGGPDQALTLFTKLKDYIHYIREKGDRLALSVKNMEIVEAMLGMITEHPTASAWLLSFDEDHKYLTEHVIRTVFGEHAVRGKLDRVIIHPETRTAWIADYKTTKDSTKKSFTYSIKRYRYDIQLAFYRRLLENYLLETYGEPFDVRCLIIPQRTCDAYNVLGVFELEEADLLSAEAEYLEALNRMKIARETGRWYLDEDYENEGITKVSLRNIGSVVEVATGLPDVY